MTGTTESIAVIGGGLIGQSWVALFTAYGNDVTVWDPASLDPASFSTGVERMRRHVREIDPGGAVKAGKIRIASTLDEAVAAASWIQENAPESLELKRKLCREIETAAADNTIIASSTTSLTWSELMQEMDRPEQLITAHPFNPPHIMPLVEIYARNAEIGDRAKCFYQSFRRVTVFLKRDAVGHIANRLASALYREAVNIVSEGIADVAAVDAAMINGPGLRWSVVGPHMAYHLGGGSGGIVHYLKHFGPSQERRWKALGSPQLTPEICAMLTAGVAEEAAGRTIADLETQRDDAIIRVLAAR